MLQKIYIALLIILAINSLTPGAQIKTDERKIFEQAVRKTSLKEYKFKIPKGKKARLAFKTNLHAGRVKFILIDPRKDPRFAIKISADKWMPGEGRGVSKDFDFIAGEWSVIVKTTEATGVYEFMWEVIDAE